MNKQARDYTCKSQQRLLMVMRALGGHEVDGVSLTELAQAIRQRGGEGTTSTIYRDLHNLREAGLAEQLPESDRWRLGPWLVQLGLTHLRTLDRTAERLAETRQRYSREPH